MFSQFHPGRFGSALFGACALVLFASEGRAQDIPYTVEQIPSTTPDGRRVSISYRQNGFNDSGELACSVADSSDPNYASRAATFNVNTHSFTVLEDIGGRCDSVNEFGDRGVTLVPLDDCMHPGVYRNGAVELFNVPPVLGRYGFCGASTTLSDRFWMATLDTGGYEGAVGRLNDPQAQGVLIPGGNSQQPSTNPYDMAELADGGLGVVGYNSHGGYFWRLGDPAVTQLPKPQGSTYAFPVLINGSGAIVASVSGAAGLQLAIYSNLQPTVIALPHNGRLAALAALDEAGNILGGYEANDFGTARHIFLRKADGTILDLTEMLSPLIDVPFAVAMNGRGQIVAATKDAIPTFYVLHPKGGLPGDMNCDGAVDGFDVEPFVLVLSDPSEYRSKFSCALNGDMNGDGQVDGFDIEIFIEKLAGGESPAHSGKTPAKAGPRKIAKAR